MTPLIKIIHQTWQTSEVPDTDYPHAWQESWKTHHLDWEYRLWTDEDNERLVRDHYPQFLSGYSKITKGVVRADLARALYLHKFGGLYVDLDYICLKPLDPLLGEYYDKLRGDRARCTLFADSTYFAAHERRMVNALMYSTPQNWILIRMIEDGLRLLDQDPTAEYGQTEKLLGSIRFGWLDQVYGSRANMGSLPRDLVCPKAPLHDRGDSGAFEAWRDLDSIGEMFPDSYAVTSWRGGWWNSRWSQANTRPKVKGS